MRPSPASTLGGQNEGEIRGKREREGRSPLQLDTGRKSERAKGESSTSFSLLECYYAVNGNGQRKVRGREPLRENDHFSLSLSLLGRWTEKESFSHPIFEGSAKGAGAANETLMFSHAIERERERENGPQLNWTLPTFVPS